MHVKCARGMPPAIREEAMPHNKLTLPKRYNENQLLSWLDKKKHKYKAKPTSVDGVRFASKKEANRYFELSLLEQSGKIRNLQLQPRYDFFIGNKPVSYESGRCAYYKADFAYEQGPDWQEIVEDVKGYDTALSRLKRALVEAMYNIKITII